MAVRRVGTPDERRSAVDHAYELFPRLAERRTQRAGTLSGGEQQMLALARALAVPPKLIIADEMSLGLAPLVVDFVFENIERASETGVTIVLIEQFIHRALGLGEPVRDPQAGVGGVDRAGRERPPGGARPLPRGVRRRHELSDLPENLGAARHSTARSRYRLARATALTARRPESGGNRNMRHGRKFHRTRSRRSRCGRTGQRGARRHRRRRADRRLDRRDRQRGQARLHLVADRCGRGHAQERPQVVPGARRRPERQGRRQRPPDRPRGHRRPVVGREPHRGAGPGPEPQGARGDRQLRVRVPRPALPQGPGRAHDRRRVRRFVLLPGRQRGHHLGARQRHPRSTASPTTPPPG